MLYLSIGSTSTGRYRVIFNLFAFTEFLESFTRKTSSLIRYYPAGTAE